MASGPEEFHWDEHNIRHIRRHGVSPREFQEAMRNRHKLIRVDDVRGERRSVVLGATNGLRVLNLVYTMRGDRIRPITAVDAVRKDRDEYFKSVAVSDE